MTLADLEARFEAQFAKLTRAIHYTDGADVTLGKLLADGETYEADVSSGLDAPFVWITFNKRSSIPAINIGVSTRKAGIEVLAYELKGGGWVVTDVNPAVAAFQLGAATGALNTPDRVQEMDTAPVDGARLMPGRTRLSSEGGMWVHVEPFSHEGGEFLGDNVLIVPTATSGKKSLVILSLNKTTNILTQTLGSDQPATYEINNSSIAMIRQDAVAIAFPTGEIRLSAVLVGQGDTTISAANILDLRMWLQPIPAAVAYPRRATLWHDEATVLTGGAFLTNVPSYANPPYNTRTYQSPPANSDSFTHSFMLEAGTYTFYALGEVDPNRGKLDWYLDGTTFITGQDWYAGTGAEGIVKSGSVTISTSGRHTLKGVVNGKNASSANYYITLVKYWFKQSTD